MIGRRDAGGVRLGRRRMEGRIARGEEVVGVSTSLLAVS